MNEKNFLPKKPPNVVGNYVIIEKEDKWPKKVRDIEQI